MTTNIEKINILKIKKLIKLKKLTNFYMDNYIS